MAKYAPLSSRLAALAAQGRETVDFAFADIADLVGGLPPSAFKYREWWANSTNVQAEAWRMAGWEVASVDFGRERVRFHHTRRTVTAAPEPVPEPEPDQPRVDVRISMTWRRAGEVVLDRDGGLVFPALEHVPGVYRLTLSGAPGQERPSVYIGESDDLRRRLGWYRAPGLTQQTNVRLSGELTHHLRAGGRVVVAIATSADVEVAGRVEPLAFGRKSARVAAEHVTLASVHLDGTHDVLNRDREVR